MNKEAERLGARLPVGAAAPEVTVLGADGQPQPLSVTWRSGPVLVTFLRHFG